MKRVGGRAKNRGMSLVEVLIATIILVAAAVAILQAYLTAAYLSQLSRDKSLALNDLKSMAESIRATPYNNILTDFPDGTQDGPAANQYVAIVSTVDDGYLLDNEHIVVQYINTAADPLEIIITVNWDDMRSRQVSSSIATMKTR